MIRIFGVKDTDFSYNGDIVIQPTKAKIHKEDNGDYYLDLEAGLEYSDYLTPNRIIAVDTPDRPNPVQAFRITNPEKTQRKITLRAYHVFYDSENYVIADSNVVDKTCNQALNHLNDATDNPSPFSMSSDVSTVDSFRCVRKSLYEAVSTVLERWGGHLVRNNYKVSITQKIGQDNGVTVRYKKNLKEIRSETNWDSVCTKILPVGYDGITLDDLYIYSDKQYDIPFTKVVSFNQDIKQEDYSDEDSYKFALKQDLRKQAKQYLAENCVPKVSYTLKANLEKITDVGDTIEVIDERLGVNIITHVTAYEYDCIQKLYTEIEFGNASQKLSDLMSDIHSSVHGQIVKNNENLKLELGGQIEGSSANIWETLSDSYVIYDGDKILIVDSLPKENAKNVIMINNFGIGFSNTGISGQFRSAWTIDNTLNMESMNVINLTADLIKGGTLKLGSNLNEYGHIEIYDRTNKLIAELNNKGLKMYGNDGSYVLLNNTVGFAGFDSLGNKIFWADRDEFHMKRSAVEEEITLCNKLRFIPITIKDDEENIVNDGIGLVSVGGES